MLSKDSLNISHLLLYGVGAFKEALLLVLPTLDFSYNDPAMLLKLFRSS